MCAWNIWSFTPWEEVILDGICSDFCVIHSKFLNAECFYVGTGLRMWTSNHAWCYEWKWSPSWMLGCNSPKLKPCPMHLQSLSFQWCSRDLQQLKTTQREALLQQPQTNDEPSRCSKQPSNCLTHYYNRKDVQRWIHRGILNQSFWAGRLTVNLGTYPWPHRLCWQTSCALRWRMAKCCCCFDGSWTWEEDWHWCQESVRGNSGRQKKERLFSHKCVRTKKKGLFILVL